MSDHVRNLCWIAGGALLIGLGADLPDLARPGMWIALVLLLHGSRALPGRGGLFYLALCLFLANAIVSRITTPVNGLAYFAIIAALTVFMLIPFVLDRWLSPRVPAWASTAVFPLALVAVEYLRSRQPHGPASFGSIAYTQYGNLPLMQLAAVTGIWGITFLLAWFAAAANRAWEHRFSGIEVRPLLFASAVLGVVVVAGSLRLALPPTPRATVRVATVTFPGDIITHPEMFRIADGRLPVDAAVAARLERLHDWFFEHTEREARAGARIVAWPEMGFLVLADQEPAALLRAQRLAAKEHVYLAMAIGAVSPGAAKPFQNKTVLVEPSGRIAYSYLKSLPVIGWEESVMQPGHGRLPVMASEFGLLSSAICFEGDHSDFLQQVGRASADLLILPVNDWPSIRRIHLEMAAFRAIENGTPLLRPASFGVSTVFDSFGRVLAATDHLSGVPTLVGEVPVGHVPTLYARLGDVFAWLCVAGTLLTVVLARKRAPRGIASTTQAALSSV